MSAENEVRELEDRRIRACCERDRKLMDTLFDATLTHCHMNGLVETREQLIDGVMNRNRFFSIERPDLNVRIMGDMAVLTGPMKVHLQVASGEDRKLEAQVTQVAKKGPDGWRFVAFQATRDLTKK